MKQKSRQALMSALLAAGACLAPGLIHVSDLGPSAVAQDTQQTTFSMEANGYKVNLDVSQAPHLVDWSRDAQKLALEWYPRLANLLPTKDYNFPKEVTIRIQKSEQGVAHAHNGVITVMSGWVEKHPEDIGLIVHELTHVVQSYRRGGPGWVTEGIADYTRWVVYEGKPADWGRFNKPRVAKGYERSYTTTAGFLFWLETTHAPGIVNELNTAMREGKYNPAIFKRASGKTVDQLWLEYVGRQ